MLTDARRDAKPTYEQVICLSSPRHFADNWCTGSQEYSEERAHSCSGRIFPPAGQWGDKFSPAAAGAFFDSWTRGHCHRTGRRRPHSHRVRGLSRLRRRVPGPARLRRGARRHHQQPFDRANPRRLQARRDPLGRTVRAGLQSRQRRGQHGNSRRRDLPDGDPQLCGPLRSNRAGATGLVPDPAHSQPRHLELRAVDLRPAAARRAGHPPRRHLGPRGRFHTFSSRPTQ